MLTVTDVDGIRQEVELRHCQVWWVLSGTLHISCRVSDGPGRPDQPSSGQPSSGQLRTIQLGAGRATVLDKGVRVSVRRQQGTVALGYRSRTEDPLPFDREAPVSTGTVPADWEDALIGQFAESLSYLRAGRTPRPAAVPVLHRPPLPLDPAARAAARIMVEDPAAPAGVAELASAVFLSPSTLNRRFREDTSLTVGAWRSRLRISVAAEYLREPGSTLESAAHQVGLSSASSLCRLFRTVAGTTPARSCRADPPEDGPRPPGETRATVRSTWPRTNRLHVLVWAFRGNCRATVGETTVDVEEGRLVWLPAGVPNHLTTDPGGMVLPVGARAGRVHGIRRPVPVPGRPDRDRLLDVIGREYDPLAAERTDTVDGWFYAFLSEEPGPSEQGGEQGGEQGRQQGGEQGRQGSAAGGDDSGLRESRVLERLLDDFRRDPTRNLTAQEWAEIAGCSVEELREALDVFGIPRVRRWAGHLRMVAARRLLLSGVPVAAVAHHLGYSGSASFSHVFRRAHGVGPRDFLGYA